ncbi:MAG: hypothetical protein AAGA10_30380, partial [Bacteroidota bacterium]
EALMMGEIPSLDETPPSSPSNVSMTEKEGRKILVWEASEELDKGSWVVRYQVYKNGKLIHKAYGTQFPFLSQHGGPGTYEIYAVNASGTISEPAVLTVE